MTFAPNDFTESRSINDLFTFLSNGNIKVELLTRARYILPKSRDKWSESQKKRAGLLFGLKLKLKEAYLLVCQIRCIFKNKK